MTHVMTLLTTSEKSLTTLMVVSLALSFSAKPNTIAQKRMPM